MFFLKRLFPWASLLQTPAFQHRYLCLSFLLRKSGSINIYTVKGSVEGCQCLHCLLQTLGKCTVSLQSHPRPTQGTGASSSMHFHNVATLRVGKTEAMAGGSLLRAGTEPSFSQNEPSTPEMQVISILKEDLCVEGRTHNVASYLLLTSAVASAAAGPARCPLSYSQGASGGWGKGNLCHIHTTVSLKPLAGQ